MAYQPLQPRHRHIPGPRRLVHELRQVAGEADEAGELFPGGDAVATLSALAGVATPNAEAANLFDLALAGDVEIAKPVGGYDLQRITIRITQDGTGGHAVAFGDGIELGVGTFADDVRPEAEAYSLVSMVYHAASDTWRVLGIA